MHQKKADKHTNKADKHANATGAVVGDGNTGDNVEQTTTAPAPSHVQEQASGAREEEMTGMNTREAAGPGVPAQDELGDRKTSTPAVSDARERAPEAGEEDMNATNPVDSASAGPVQDSEVPMHGSGVPTHSTLHSNSNPGNETHDVRTTQTMEGSPNTGSYM